MVDGEFEYRLMHSRGTKPLMNGDDLHNEVETTRIPSGGVRWEFSTRYRVSKSSYRNVLLQSILEMCKKNKLTPLEIRHPLSLGGRQFVDIVFGNADEVLDVYEKELTFDFYGTKPKIVNRGIPDRKHVALCIQMLPSDTDLNAVLKALQEHARIRKAGQIVDVWSLHCPTSGKFKGKVLVLLELHVENGAVPLEDRSAIPGWFKFDAIAYLVRFADRPAWCVHCRSDEKGGFHSRFTCPYAPCITCKEKSHASVRCPKRRAQVAKKISNGQNHGKIASYDDDDDDDTYSTPGGASMERRFAELGIRGNSQEADELARDFGVLALSEDDIGN